MQFAQVPVRTKTGEEYEFVVDDGERFINAVGRFPGAIKK